MTLDLFAEKILAKSQNENGMGYVSTI
jgi:hypothetical protein